MFLVFSSVSFLHFSYVTHDRAIRRKNTPEPARIFIVLLALAFFILLSEFIQENFIPGRGYEFSDILSGFAGTLSGLLAFLRFQRYN